MCLGDRVSQIFFLHARLPETSCTHNSSTYFPLRLCLGSGQALAYTRQDAFLAGFQDLPLEHVLSMTSADFLREHVLHITAKHFIVCSGCCVVVCRVVLRCGVVRCVVVCCVV